MSRMLGTFAIILLVTVTATCSAPARPAPVVAPAVDPRISHQDSVEAFNTRMVQDVLAKVGDRQNSPAGQVFTNVSIMPNPPVRTFLTIMKDGYARALGVRCTYCHVEGDFASDDKRQKRAAREMAAMHRSITQQLQAMQNIDLPLQNRFINCSTCHRGAINPLTVPERVGGR